MKRRAFFSLLIGSVGAAAAASPAEARRRHRRDRSYQAFGGYGRRRQRQSYEDVSYQEPIYTGASTPAPTQRRQQVTAQQPDYPSVTSQEQAAGITHRTRPFEGAQRYGVNGSVTNSEANVLKSLDYSKGQSYHAIKSRIGFPAYRNGNTDYYEAKGGWVAIDYKDGKAYGTRAEFR